MADEDVNPRIMASTTVRPTLVVAKHLSPTTHAPELTPGISSVAQVMAVVRGVTLEAARQRLEAVGFEVRVISRDGQPDQEPAGSRGECANLSMVEGRVTDVLLA